LEWAWNAIFSLKALNLIDNEAGETEKTTHYKQRKTKNTREERESIRF
jgi:hypothetical protein